MLLAFNNVCLKRTRILSVALYLLFFFVVSLIVYNVKHSRKGTPVVLQRCCVVIHVIRYTIDNLMPSASNCGCRIITCFTVVNGFSGSLIKYMSYIYVTTIQTGIYLSGDNMYNTLIDKKPLIKV